MIALFLLLVIVAIALGIVGVVVKGLLYLLFIGIVVFLGALLLALCGCGDGLGSARRGNPRPTPDTALIRLTAAHPAGPSSLGRHATVGLRSAKSR